jgi:hypothetical protein
MNSAEEIRKIIEHQIETLDIDRTPEMLYKPIRYALGSGGKRMRPVLTLLSCEVFSDQWQSALNVAMAIEVFHNFTLLHDDIMDNSSVRRGQPTVHCRWNDNTAILSGDAMSILAYEILGKSAPKLIVKLLPIFTKVALEVYKTLRLAHENSMESLPLGEMTVALSVVYDWAHDYLTEEERKEIELLSQTAFEAKTSKYDYFKATLEPRYNYLEDFEDSITSDIKFDMHYGRLNDIVNWVYNKRNNSNEFI